MNNIIEQAERNNTYAQLREARKSKKSDNDGGEEEGQDLDQFQPKDPFNNLTFGFKIAPPQTDKISYAEADSAIIL